jgi:hypothetical protein
MLSVAINPKLLNVIMLSSIMLGVIMLGVIMLNVIMLSFIMLNVVAPDCEPSLIKKTFVRLTGPARTTFTCPFYKTFLP